MDLLAHTAKAEHEGKDEDEDKEEEKDKSNVFWTPCAQKQMILALTLLLHHPAAHHHHGEILWHEITAIMLRH